MAQYGDFIRSVIEKKDLRLIEVAGKRGDGLLKNAINIFGMDALFISTVRGIEGVLEKNLKTADFFTLSEDYFHQRLEVKDAKSLTKLVKQFVNELLVELKTENLNIAVIYRANDLHPFTSSANHNYLNEEFWRLLTNDLRLTGYTFMFVYEEADHQPDMLSYFADAVVKLSSPPQLWSIL